MASPSYLERSARERISLLQDQMFQSVKEDSTLNRLVKEKSKKDFKQERQPAYATFAYTSGIMERAQFGSMPLGQMRKSAKTGQVTMDVGKFQGGTEPNKFELQRFWAGGRTTLSPEGRWTTEGYQAQKEAPASYGKFANTLKRAESETSFNLKKKMKSVIAINQGKPILQMQYPGVPAKGNGNGG